MLYWKKMYLWEHKVSIWAVLCLLSTTLKYHPQHELAESLRVKERWCEESRAVTRREGTMLNELHIWMLVLNPYI